MIPKAIRFIIRRSLQSKVYTAINITGITVALTIGLLMYSFLAKEFQTDRFHQNRNSIYRVASKYSPSDPFSPGTNELLAPAVANRIPGIKNYVRLWYNNLYVKPETSGNYGKPEQCISADRSFFDIFTFPFTEGGLSSDSPKNWAVISQSAAARYFGQQNPVGHTVTVTGNGFLFKTPEEYQIVAVMQDIPAWSTIQGDLILNFGKVAGFSDWNNNSMFYTYLQLENDAPIPEIEAGIGKLYAENTEDSGRQVLLQPLSNVYFNPENVYYAAYMGNTPAEGSLSFTRMLCIITLLILLLSSCNYVMIRIAQGKRNLGMFAVQQCFGANGRYIRKQCIQETAFLFSLSGGLAVLPAAWMFPGFRQLLSPLQPYPFPLSWTDICIISVLFLAFVLAIGYILSSYFIRNLSRNSIKDSIRPQVAAFDLKKMLATVQIVIFGMLLVSSAIVHKQMSFLKNKDIGYNNHSTLSVYGHGSALKSKLLSHPDILAASTGDELPAYKSLYFSTTCLTERNTEVEAEMIGGDADYLSTYQIQLAEGEFFNANTLPRREGLIPVVVNREFAKQAGLQPAVGSLLRDKDDPERNFQIIGVVNDFNVYSLYKHIKPLILAYSTGPNTGICNTGITTVRYRENKRAEIIAYLDQEEIPYNSEYRYESLYSKENAFVLLINAFTLTAIVIGGLGVFSFSVFLAENRRKEMALRKINGATEWDIQRLFNLEFIRITLCACLAGLPLAYYFMTFWLREFAYRTPLEWWFFPAAAAGCLLLVLLVITWQIRKTVTLNPIESLHNE